MELFTQRQLAGGRSERKISYLVIFYSKITESIAFSCVSTIVFCIIVLYNTFDIKKR